MTDLEALIERLRPLAERATPGPWLTEKPANPEGLTFPPGIIIAATGQHMAIYADPPGGSYPANDRAYIAAANPQTILQLLDTLSAALKVTEPVSNEIDARDGDWFLVTHDEARAIAHWRQTGKERG